MTVMTYTAQQIKRKNAIYWSANRLQYMTNQDKLLVSSQMFDRGLMTTNMIMDIWDLPHVQGGDKRYIRKEYTEVGQLGKLPEPIEPGPVGPENQNKEGVNDTDGQDQAEE
jgi:hypothetical protein